MSAVPRSTNEFLDAQFDKSIEGIANSLRDLADAVEREGKQAHSRRGDSPHVKAASFILSRVTNHLNHLSLGLLVQRAHEADTLREDEE